MAQSFTGPIPPPEHLVNYERVLPGLANRIVTMAEKEQAHRHEQEQKGLDCEIVVAKERCSEITRGQVLGFGAIALAIVIGAFLGFTGHEVSGSVLGGSGIVTLASVFIWGRDGKPN